MNRTRRALNVGFLATTALLSAGQAHAFDTNEHLAVTAAAADSLIKQPGPLNQIGSAYPDIQRFRDTIVNWSGGANYAPAVFLHLDNATPAEQLAHMLDQTADICNVPWNGGNFEDGIFKSITEKKYPSGNFANTLVGYEGAYVLMGSAVHLIEDQASMPHAANIHHGACPSFSWPPITFDHFETPPWKVSASLSGNPAANVPRDQAYLTSLHMTRGIVGNYTSPSTGARYWLRNEELAPGGPFFDPSISPSKNTTPYNGEWMPTEDFFGTYGGPGYLDVYSDTYWPYLYAQQGTQAADFAYFFLKKMSEKLPPIASRFTLLGLSGSSPPIVDGQTDTPITFVVAENRTPGVTVDLYVKDALGNTQTAVTADADVYLDGGTSATGKTVSQTFFGPLAWQARPVPLWGTKPDPNLLPFQAAFTLNWTGTVLPITAAGAGTPLPDGDYTLCLNVTDGDQNAIDPLNQCNYSIPFVMAAPPAISTAPGGLSNFDKPTNQFYANVPIVISAASPLDIVEFIQQPLGQIETSQLLPLGPDPKTLITTLSGLPDGFYQIVAHTVAGGQNQLNFELATGANSSGVSIDTNAITGLSILFGGVVGPAVSTAPADVRTVQPGTTYFLQNTPTSAVGPITSYSPYVSPGVAVSIPQQQWGSPPAWYSENLGFVIDSVNLPTTGLQRHVFQWVPQQTPPTLGVQEAVDTLFELRSSTRADVPDDPSLTTQYTKMGTVDYSFDPTAGFGAFFAGQTYSRNVNSSALPMPIQKYVQGRLTITANQSDVTLWDGIALNIHPTDTLDFTGFSGFMSFNGRAQSITLSTAPLVPNTPAGQNPPSVCLSSQFCFQYQNVSSAGETSASLTPANLPLPQPLPQGWRTFAGSTVFDATTTAQVSGNITLTAPYSAAQLLSFETSSVYLAHLVNGAWSIGRTAQDPVTQKVTNVVPSLSPFAVVLQDTFPPNPITDLAVVNISTYAATLQWTASGEDYSYGTAQAYDVRYATQRITSDSQFSAAHPVIQHVQPQVAGSTETFVVPALMTGGTFYFAVKVIDHAGNPSALSNSPSAFILRDVLPPRTQVGVFGPVTGTSTVVVSTQSFFFFIARDDAMTVGDGLGAGVARTLFAIDGGTFSVYAATFSLISGGTHTLAFYSVDVLGHAESTRTVTVGVDAVPPVLAFTFPASNAVLNAHGPPITVGYYDPDVAPGFPGFGVDPMSVRVVINGMDYSTQAVISSTQAQLSLAVLLDGVYVATITVADLVGNSTAASIVFSLDTTPPVTQMQIFGPSAQDAQGNTVVSSNVALGLLPSDPVSGGVASGVAKTFLLIDVTPLGCPVDPELQVPDPTAPQGSCQNPVFTSTFTLNAGAHTLYFFSVDKAGNSETGHFVPLAVVTPAAPNPQTVPFFQFSFKFGSAGTGPGQFQAPKAIALDAAGNAYVTDNHALQVFKFDPSGNFLLSWGGAGSGPGQFGSFIFDQLSIRAAPDMRGDVYVTDYQNKRVQKFASDGTFLFQISTDPATGQYYFHPTPADVAVDSRNNLWALDPYGSQQLLEFDSSGNLLQGFRLPNVVPYFFPNRLAIGPNDDVYVAMYPWYSSGAQGKIQRYDRAITFITEWLLQQKVVAGLDVDAFGNAYASGGLAVAGGGAGVNVFSSTGAFIASIGNVGSAGQTLQTSTGVAVNKTSGSVYIVDDMEKDVKVYSLSLTPPAPPTVLSPAGGGTVRTFTPLILGQAEGLSFVTMTDETGMTVGTATATTSGSFQMTTQALSKGRHVLALTATDAAGHVSAASLPAALDVEFPNPIGFSTGAVVPAVMPDPVHNTDLLGIGVLVTGDFTGHGLKDVLGFGDHGYSIFAALPGGGFQQQPPVLATGMQACNIDNYGDMGYANAGVGDFNGDGFLDVVAICYAGSQLRLLPGIGAGQFQSDVLIANGSWSRLVVGDWNKDGILDIVAVDNTGMPFLFLGKGGGAFQTPVALSAAPLGQGLAVGDVDGDGNPDLIVGSTILFGDGAGHFTSTPLPSAVSGITAEPVIADFNGDRRNDILLFGQLGILQAGYQTFLSTGNRGFLPTAPTSFGNVIVVHAVGADFNRDGLADVAFTPGPTGLVEIMTGNGDGTFSSPVSVSQSIPLASGGTLLAADFNGDGLPDLLKAANGVNIPGFASAGFVTFLNQTAPPDTIPPAPITDLVVTSTVTGSLALQWTAVGDDGNIGTASSYVLKVATFPISNAAFDSIPALNTLVLMPSPAPAGTPQFAQVGGFNPPQNQFFPLPLGTTYYVRMKVLDKVQNASLDLSSPLARGVVQGADLAISSSDITLAVVGGNLQVQACPSNIGPAAAVLPGMGFSLDSTTVPVNTLRLFAGPYFPPGGCQAINSAFRTATFPLPAPGQHFVTVMVEQIPGLVPAGLETNMNNNVAIASFGIAPGGSVDVVPPAKVTDLAAQAAPTGGVLLTWTAPGDDLSSGTAAAYDIRFATVPIAEGSFASAIQVSNPPAPRVAGTPESFVVGNLAGGTTFFFALRAVDAAGNAAPASNDPSLRTAFVTQSSVPVDGNPELVFSVSNATPTVTILSTTSAAGAVVLGTATAQGLLPVSTIYDLGPEGIAFSPAAILVIRYSTQTLARLGVLEQDLAIYHYDSSLGAVVKVPGQTLDAADKLLSVSLTSVASIFGLFAVIVDRTPPVTNLRLVGGRRFMDASGNLYVSSSAAFSFDSFDPVVLGTASGVARTEYAVDQAGGPFAIFAASFTLVEGLHALYFRSVDNAGNAEVTRSSGVRVDATPPATQIAFATQPYMDTSSRTYIGGNTAVGFTAQDPVSSNVASGLALTEYRVDAASGAAFAPFVSTFTLAEGAHVIDFRSRDNVGNTEVSHSSAVYVDATPPFSAVHISSPQFVAADGTLYTNPATPVTVSAEDPPLASSSPGTAAPGAGINHIEVAVDTTTFSVYASTLTFAEGRHALLFRAVDNAGNVELAHTLLLRSDNTPPVTQVVLSTPSFVDASSRAYVSGGDLIGFSASDPVVGGAASGVAFTQYRLDASTPSAPFQLFVSSVALSQGAHALDYRSVDNAANAETLKTFSVISDTTPPATTIAVGSPSYSAPDGSLYVTPATPVTLSALDPAIASGVPGSGVGLIELSIDGNPFAAYVSTLTFGAGIHTLQYHALDNAGNSEVVHILTLRSDNTPPVTTLTPSGTFYVSNAANFAPASFLYGLSAQDPVVDGVASGVRQSLYGINGGMFAVFAASFTLSEGIDRVDWRSADNVGNGELPKSATFYIDATPPVTTLAVGAPQLPLAGGLVAVGTDTLIAFQATDPVVNGVASGLRQTQYSVADGPYVVFSASFTLSPAGAPQALSFFSQDNVLNAEAAKTATLIVDTVAPSIAISLPVAGATYVADQSTIAIAFSVSDPYDLAPSSYALLVETSHLQGPLSGSTSAVVTNGQLLSPLSLDQGLWQLQVSAANALGLSTAAVSGTFEVIHDIQPPRTSLAIGPPSFVDASGRIFVTGHSSMTLSSVDDLITPGDGVGLGVAFQGLSVDGIARAAFTDASPAAGQVFVSTFTMAMDADGTHVLSYLSQDVVGNREALHLTTVAVDNTPPVVQFQVLGSSYADARGNLDISTATTLAFAATDPAVNGEASGVRQVEYQVDGGTFAVPPGAFTLSGPDGARRLGFFGTDNMGNASLLANATVFLDATPPVTSLAIGSPSFLSGGMVFVSTLTPFSLSSVDPVVNGVASGVQGIFAAQNDGAFAAYAGAFTWAAPDGIKPLFWFATDNVGNQEIVKSTSVALDGTPPMSSFAFGSPYYQAPDGTNYVTPGTSVTFSAVDSPLPNGRPGSGVNRLEAAVDGRPFAANVSPLAFGEGRHAVLYRSIDNVANVEATKTLQVQSDNTPPFTTLAILGGHQFPGPDGISFYASLDARYALPAADPAVNGVASGVASTRWQDNGGPFQMFSSTLSLAEGVHHLSYQSQDDVQNLEVLRSTTALVDATPPHTALAIIGGHQFPGPNTATFYASSDTRFALPAVDPAVNGVASGVAFTRWQDSGGTFQTYASSFGLVEGAHVVGYQSQDNVANLEVPRSTNAWIDAAPPITSFAFGTSYYRGADGINYITPVTPVTFTAADPALPGGQPGSGVGHIEITIDGGPFVAYVSSLTFAEGRHTILYRSIDNVGNVEAAHALALQSDNTPPLTSLAVSSPSFSQGPGRPAFVSAATILTLAAADPVSNGVASGVALTRYRFNGGSFLQSPLAFNLAGPDGLYAIDYQSQDNVGNLEVLRSTAVLLDQTPPATAVHVGAPSFTAADGTLYITPGSPVTFTAVDPSSGSVASGVDHIETAVDGGAFSVYAATLTFGEGRHTVRYRAVDNVGNVETTRTLALQSDNTPPITAFFSTGTFFMIQAPEGARNYAPTQFTYALSAQDPVVGDVASGVASTTYRTGQVTSFSSGSPQYAAGPFQSYASPFGLAEGIRRVDFQSRDNVGNLELLKSATVFVDATPPVTTLSIGSPQATLAGAVYVSTTTMLSLASQDPVVQEVASGVRQISVGVSNGPFSTYTGPFSLPSPDGLKGVVYFATDNVGNGEVAKSTTVALDATPPSTSLAIQGGRQFPGPNASNFYASSDTRFGFSAFDPVVNGVASGVAFSQYQDCGNTPGCPAPFQAFVSGFYLPEGAHALSYQSRDNVQNLEVPRSTNVLIDATPPATTVGVGQPSYTSPSGTLYVSTQTPIAFSAADPALPTGQPGSGVNRIEVSIDGAPFAAYGSPLLLAEGAHTVLYRAVDNVGNFEASHTLAVQADATPPMSLLSIGRPQFALSSATVLVSSRTPFSIAAVDPVVNGVASGVRQSFYRINNSSFTAYSAPFALSSLSAGVVPPDGPQSIFFYSQDNVLNAEAAKSVVVSLDATAPQAAILSPSASDSGICRVLKGVFPILGSVLDAHLASYVLDFAPGQNAGGGSSSTPAAPGAINATGATSGFTLISSATFGTGSPGFGTALVGVSSGALGVWNAAALSGWQTLRLTALDLVQNATVVTVNVYVGDPAELLVLGNHTLFNMPRGVAVDSGRDIYVADTNDNQIKEFTSTGTFFAAFGLGDGRAHARNFDPDDNPTSSGAALRLNKPKGVAVDARGNIYVADTNDDRVLELSATGQVLLELGKRSVDGTGREHFKPGQNPGEFNAPSAVAVGASGSIYVVDTENRRVQVFNSTGGVALVVYMPALTPFCTGPGGSAPCALPGNDDDSGEDGYTPGPGVGNLGRPEGVAVDLAGNIYVADPQGSRALKFDPTGKLLLTIPILGQPGSQNANGGSGSSGPLVQSEPNGIAVSPSGDCILVSDRKFARVLKFDALGNQLLSFGTQGKIPDNQALPTGIVFQKPVGLALDSLGNLYVADRNNDRIEAFGLPTGQPVLVVPPPVSDPNAARDVVASADGGAVSRQDGASVQVPPGALAQDLKITVSTATDQDALQISLASKKAGEKGLQVAYAPISFSPEGTQFQQAVTLVMPYTPDLLLAQGITEDQLAIDYWNPTKSDWEALPSVVDKVNHLVTAKTTHFSLYQVHSGTGSVRAQAAPQPAADPTFVFRDLYAFPNPAVRGKSPTIRLQVGVADSVELHIYDISGKLVHQAGITAPPQPLDDGNGKGAQYTYDYPWDVSGVGSGVYIYSVTAKKAGKTDIRRIKKVGVVR